MIDRIGLVFGRLTVKSVALNSQPKNIKYVCQCECGTEKVIGLRNLTKGSTKSCGCLAKENMERLLQVGAENRAKKIQAQKMRLESIPPSKTKHPLFQTWKGMVRRCCDPTSDNYNRYGAKGITVCAEWKDDFWKFVADMGDKPGPTYSVDRIDGEGNYEPSNCRWADEYTQATNRKKGFNVPVATIKGKTLMCTKWAKMLDISIENVHNDIKKGYSPEVAVIATKMRKALWVEKKGTPTSYEQCYEEAKKYLQRLDKGTSQS